MLDLHAESLVIQSALEGIGVPCAFSDADLSGEGVLLIPPYLVPKAYAGRWEATWTAYVLVSDSGTPAVFRSAGALLTKVLPLLGFTEAVPVEIAGVTGGRRPGYRIRFTTKIQETQT